MADAQKLIDGFTTLEGGMDGGRSPELLSPNQCSLLVNGTFRGNYPRSRPGFRQPRTGYDSGATESWFKTNRVQGAGYYNCDGKTPVTVIAVGGKVFEKRMSNFDAYVHDITPVFPPGSADITGKTVSGQVDRNSNRQPKVWMCQAEQYLIIQDNLSSPIIYDGATARRAGELEVPVGSCMAYGLGRLVVANGRDFVVGDLLGGGTEVYQFTETTYLNEGGAFTLPADMGDITGMVFMAKQDTSTGQGILLVFAENGVASVDLSQPRANWKSSQIQQVALPEIGSTSHQSLTLINGDVFFRSKDGIRSYRDSRAQQNGYGRTPISYEINSILDYDSPSLLIHVSAVYFDNRFLMTVSPKKNAEGAIFRGIGVMDFVPVTSTRSPAAPCFDGLWTGIQPVALVRWNYKKGDRCFAICTDDDGNNQIWEITKSDSFDNVDQPIESCLESRLMKFSPSPFYTTLGDQGQYKELQDGILWLSKMQGIVQFKVSFRPDQYPFWVEWCEFAVGYPSETCGQRPICSPIPMFPPQYRGPLQLPQVPDTCDANGPRDMLKMGFGFQVQIKWIGCAAIPRLLLNAIPADIKAQECIGESAYGMPECDPVPITYYSFPLSANCPNGTTGGPINVGYGAFTSTISQEDANSEAQAHLEELVAAGCVPPPPPPGSVVIVFSGPAGENGFNPADPGPIQTQLSIDGGSFVTPVSGTEYPITSSVEIRSTLAIPTGTQAYNTYHGFQIKSKNGGSLTFHSGHATLQETHGSNANGTGAWSGFPNYEGEESTGITNVPNIDPAQFGAGYVAGNAPGGTTINAAVDLPSALTVDANTTYTGSMGSEFEFGTDGENYSGTFKLQV